MSEKSQPTNRRSRALPLFALAGIIVLAVAGAAVFNATRPSPSASTALDEVVIAFTGEPPTLGADQGAQAFGRGTVNRNIQEALVDRDPVDATKIIPVLASDWKRIDERTIRFNLRRGIKFHDGSPFNAEAAAFGISLVFDPSRGFIEPQGYIASPIAAKAVDEYTVDVFTRDPDPILLNRLAAALITSKQQFDTQGLDAYATHPIGTGPYKFVEWKKGEYVQLERNPDWWATSGNHQGVDLGKAVFKRARFVFRNESQSRISALQAGEVHLALTLPDEECLKAFGQRCVAEATSAILIFRPDVKFSKVLADIRVREAMAIAIDRGAVARDIYLSGEPISQMAWKGAVGHNPNLKFPYDPDRARELVQAAARDGIPISTPLDVTAIPVGQNRAAGEYVADAWRKIGLNANLKMMEQTEWYQSWVTPKDFKGERHHVDFGISTNALFDLSRIIGLHLRCDGIASTYCNPALDKMASEAAALEGDARQKAFERYAEALYKDFAVIPVVSFGSRNGVSERLDWKPRTDRVVYLREMQPAGAGR